MPSLFLTTLQGIVPFLTFAMRINLAIFEASQFIKINRMPTEKKKGGFFRKLLTYFILLLIAGSILFYFIASYTYSEGHRAGVLIKFSKRGVIFKTYEGELNQGGTGNVPNTAQFNAIWEFSVKDEAVAEQLRKLEGRKVSVHYQQKVKNFPWDGETVYFVDDVEVIE
jgi:hypothetical protein